MNHNFKILKIVLATFILFVYTPFLPAPRAYADQTGSVANCMAVKGTAAVAAATAANTLSATEIATAAAGAATAATAAATTAATVNVPVTNIVLAPFPAATAAENTTHAAITVGVNETLKAIAYITAQCALEELTNSTIRWIQGGFHGSPNFAVSPKKILNKISDTVATQFSNQIRGLGMCNFTPNFVLSLSNLTSLSTYDTKSAQFASSVKCPFNIGEPETFYNNFSDGGWDSFTQSLNDAGNPFGIAVLTGNELKQRQTQRDAIEQQQLQWAHGFIDLVDNDPAKCDYIDENEYPDSPDGIALDSTGRPDPAQYDPEVITSIEEEYCPTTTPGNVISDQLTKTLGTDMDRLGLADDMNKIISALITSFMQETVKAVFK